MWDLSSWPGIEPVPSVVEAQSLNYWTTREVRSSGYLVLLYIDPVVIWFYFSSQWYEKTGSVVIPIIMSSAPGNTVENGQNCDPIQAAPSPHSPPSHRWSVINDSQAAAGGLTHGGDVGQLILSLLGVEQVCLALLYSGSPQSSNNGNMAREKDVTLFATMTTLTAPVPGCQALY